MPCYSDYMEPTLAEKESTRVISFLREVGIFDETYRKVSQSYGDTKRLHEDTSALCSFLKKGNPKLYSLELQIWWRDHQLMDRRHELERLIGNFKEEGWIFE